MSLPCSVDKLALSYMVASVPDCFAHLQHCSVVLFALMSYVCWVRCLWAGFDHAHCQLRQWLTVFSNLKLPECIIHRMLHTISVLTLRRVGCQQGFYHFWDANPLTAFEQQTTMAQFHNRSRYQEVLYDLFLWQCGMVFARVSSKYNCLHSCSAFFWNL